MSELYRAFAGIGAGAVLSLLTALMAATLPSPAWPATDRVTQASTAAAHACRDAAAAAEDERRIPAQLLTAIGFVESARWSDAHGTSFAWPWTVTSGAQSWHLPSKAAAIDKVRALRAAGETNIDVGCFQVNLYWHGDAFANLAEAFDPRANAAYAAKFLRQLRDEHHSWMRAVAYYHSREKAANRDYRGKVKDAWPELRNRAMKARLAQRN